MEWEEVEDLATVAADVDVLYQTRIQKERFLDRLEDYEAARGKYIIDRQLLGAMKRDAVIMHPLPRVDEVRACHISNSTSIRFHSSVAFSVASPCPAVHVLFMHSAAIRTPYDTVPVSHCRLPQMWTATHGQRTSDRQRTGCTSEWR